MKEITKETLTEWRKLQKGFCERLQEIDRIPPDEIKYILAMYLYVDKSNQRLAVISAIVWDYSVDGVGKAVSIKIESVVNDIPYISGYLGFREVPVYMRMFKEIAEQYTIDMVIINSYGKLHDVQGGSATQLALEIDTPVIGVGRTLLSVDGLQEKDVKKLFKESCDEKGDYVELIGKSGKTYGGAVKTASGSKNPIYVSIGSFVSLSSAIEIVTNVSKCRVPEPIRCSEAEAKSYLATVKGAV